MSISKSLNILLLEPFYSGSHKQWADGLIKYSRHNITLSTLPGRHWKWRMHGAALTFAERHEKDMEDYDLVIVTDMCDVATLRGLININVPVILYFHENQLAYPLSETDQKDNKNWDRRYMWINLTSAMAADHIWFNSEYNRNSFLGGLPKFLKPFPDRNKFALQRLKEKSKVVPLGIELNDLLKRKNEKMDDNVSVILWNHRWEYDKRPELFFKCLRALTQEDIDFKVIVMGTRTGKYPSVFDRARDQLGDRLLHIGEVATREEYVSMVKMSDIVPVTSIQDFFGISVVEAIAGGVIPVLPQRLAFKEHLPMDLFPELFYDSDDEFYEKLKHILLNRSKYELKGYVRRYDWEVIIGMYDDAFLKLNAV